jgi:hypothetical protein
MNSIYPSQFCSSFNPGWLLFNSGLIEINSEGGHYYYRVFYRPNPDALSSTFFSCPLESYEQAVIEAKLRVLRMSTRRSQKMEILTDLATGHLLEQSHPHRRCFGTGTQPKPVLSQDLCENPAVREQAISQLIEEYEQLIECRSLVDEASYCFKTTVSFRPINLDGSKQEESVAALKLYCLSRDVKILVERFISIDECWSQQHA